MPLWIKIYLILYTLLVIGGLHDDYEKKRSAVFYLCGISSCAFIYIFTIAYFNPSLARSIGMWFLPMVIIGVLWEFYSTANEIIRNEHDPELTEKQNRFIENFAMVFVNLFIIPGYFLGFVLSYKAIKGNL